MSQEVLVTLIVTLGSVAAAFFGYLGIKAGVRRSKRRFIDQNPAIEEDDELLASYESDPGSVMLGLMRENRALRGEIDKTRADQSELWNELRDLRTELDKQRREETRFRDALGRWLIELFASWGKTEKMPWPSAPDFEVLRPVLPDRRQSP